MSGFIKGEARSQATLFPERIDDYISKENTVKVVDVFIDGLDLSSIGFKLFLLSLSVQPIIRLAC
jgi:hypothetical protein